MAFGYLALSSASMPVCECQISFIDSRGIKHSTTVHASSVLEAAALGLKQIREVQMVEDEGVIAYHRSGPT